MHDRDRWLSPLEMLSLQCFPVFKECAVNAEECSFRIPRSGRSGRRLLEQSGNSMPVALISLPLLWAFTQTPLAKCSRPQTSLSLCPFSVSSASSASAVNELENEEQPQPIELPSAATLKRVLKRALSNPPDGSVVDLVDGRDKRNKLNSL